MKEREPLLVVKRLSKNFGGLLAVNQVDFEVLRGEICGIIGPNGAGKTTLFNLISGELRPSSGEMYFQGHNLTGFPSYAIARQGIARLFQLADIFESMTVAENVIVGAEKHDRLKLFVAFTHLGGYRAESIETLRNAEEAMTIMGVAHLAGRVAANLPFGQQRLVSAARALAARPHLLLLDEPAAGLSETETETLRVAISRARSAGVTVLIIEHNVELVMAICDHVVVMNFGEKIAEGRPEEVRRTKIVEEVYLGQLQAASS